MGERFFNAAIFYLPEKLNFGNLRGLLWINNKHGLAFVLGVVCNIQKYFEKREGMLR